MEVLFDGSVHVDYPFLALEAPESPYGLVGTGFMSMGGQANGICGARVPCALLMRTGLHTGHVPLRVERYDERPDLADEWEDVVEVSLTVIDADYAITAFESTDWLPTIAPGEYRARWCAAGMDAGRDQDNTGRDEAPDRYLLQLWPHPPGAEVVVRQGSELAAYWAGVAAETSPPDLDELREQGWGVDADDLLEDRELTEEEVAQRVALMNERMRGDRPPNPTLREWGDQTLLLAQLDRDLLDELTDLSPGVLRALAVQATRTLAEEAGGMDRPPVVEALDVVARGGTLPEVWQDWESAERIFATDEEDDETAEGEVVSFVAGFIGDERPQHIPMAIDVAAIEAIRGAATEQDGRAAAHAVFCLLSRADDPAVAAAEVRAAITRLCADGA
ncbi:hypothetical protein [Cellulomonas palmilytica]|uniref:hypothetical protein n=1 Tax=Cellulomonas palmilytica TaxID=2608402 RepID=UPI001F2A99D4|nr:hypothetical protein [Cellulomonas palmilytica]UJP40369.1 hypothetical protein F1D97_02210 [Cellulomonas palmilytica]